MMLAQNFTPSPFLSCSVILFCFVVRFTIQPLSSLVALRLIITCSGYVNGADEMCEITSVDQQNKLGNKESSNWSDAGALTLE